MEGSMQGSDGILRGRFDRMSDRMSDGRPNGRPDEKFEVRWKVRWKVRRKVRCKVRWNVQSSIECPSFDGMFDERFDGMFGGVHDARVADERDCHREPTLHAATEAADLWPLAVAPTQPEPELTGHSLAAIAWQL